MNDARRGLITTLFLSLTLMSAPAPAEGASAPSSSDCFLKAFQSVVDQSAGRRYLTDDPNAPTFRAELARGVRDNVLEEFRVRSTRTYPVEVLENGTQIKAAYVSRDSLGTLTPEQQKMLNADELKSEFDSIQASVSDYPKQMIALLDTEDEARLRIRVLNDRLGEMANLPKSAQRQKAPMELPVISNGQLAPETEHVYYDRTKIRAEIHRLQKVLENLKGSAKIENSYKYTAYNQLLNLEALRVVREQYLDSMRMAARQKGSKINPNDASTWPDEIRNRVQGIDAIFEATGEIKNTALKPPDVAYESAQWRDLRNEVTLNASLIRTNVSQGRLFKKLPGAPSSASEITTWGRDAAVRIYKYFKPASSSTAPATGGPGDEIAQALNSKPLRTTYQDAMNFLNSLSDTDKSAAGLTSPDSKKRLFYLMKVAGVGGIGVGGVSGFNYANDMLHQTSWYKRRVCTHMDVSGDDPTFLDCVNDYIQTKYLFSYINTISRSKGVTLDQRKEQLVIDPNEVDTSQSSSSPVKKNLLTGQLMLAPGFFANIENQSGIMQDPKTLSLEINPNALALNSPTLFSKDSKGKVILSLKALFAGREKQMIEDDPTVPGRMQLTKPIREDIDALVSDHEDYLKKDATSAEIYFLVRAQAVKGNPCFADNLPLWISGDIETFKVNILACEVKMSPHLNQLVAKKILEIADADPSTVQGLIDDLTRMNLAVAGDVCGKITERMSRLNPRSYINLVCPNATMPNAPASTGTTNNNGGGVFGGFPPLNPGGTGTPPAAGTPGTPNGGGNTTPGSTKPGSTTPPKRRFHPMSTSPSPLDPTQPPPLLPWQ